MPERMPFPSDTTLENLGSRRNKFVKEGAKYALIATAACVGYSSPESIYSIPHTDGKRHAIAYKKVEQSEDHEIMKTKYYAEIIELFDDSVRLARARLKPKDLSTVKQYLHHAFIKLADGTLIPYIPTQILVDGEIRLQKVIPNKKVLENYGLTADEFEKSIAEGIADFEEFTGGMLDVKLVSPREYPTEGIMIEKFKPRKKNEGDLPSKTIGGAAHSRLNLGHSALLGNIIQGSGRWIALTNQTQFQEGNSYSPKALHDMNMLSIRTTVAHELGHLLLGNGHLTDAPGSLMAPVGSFFAEYDDNGNEIGADNDIVPDDPAAKLTRTMLGVMQKEYPHVGYGTSQTELFGGQKYYIVPPDDRSWKI